MSKSQELPLEAVALLDAIGGEPLAGSGFEAEPDFVADELARGEWMEDN